MGNKKSESVQPAQVPPMAKQMNMLDALATYYEIKVKPLEQYLREFNVKTFHRLERCDITHSTSAMVIGSKGVGKTTAVNYLIRSTYPGSSNNTKEFFILMHGTNSQMTNASNMAQSKAFPFPSLLNMPYVDTCYVAFSNSPLLRHITIVDTPGFPLCENVTNRMSEKQQACLKFLAKRVDLILLIVEARRIDVMKRTNGMSKLLRTYYKKLIIILNKCDEFELLQLYDIRSDVIWNLRETLTTENLPTTLFGSLWECPISTQEKRHIFQIELEELFNIFRNCCDSIYSARLNAVIKRAAMAKCLVNVCHTLKTAPKRKRRKKSKMQNTWIKILQDAAYELKRNCGTELDFRPILRLEAVAKSSDRKALPSVPVEMIEPVDAFLKHDVKKFETLITTYKIQGLQKTGFKSDLSWGMVAAEAAAGEWRLEFKCCYPSNNMLDFIQAQQVLQSSSVHWEQQKRIWRLVDADRDGLINENEFLLLKFLMQLAVRKQELPNAISDKLRPPPMNASKANRYKIESNAAAVRSLKNPRRSSKMNRK